MSGRQADLPADYNILSPEFLRMLIMRGDDNPVMRAHGITIVHATVCETNSNGLCLHPVSPGVGEEHRKPDSVDVDKLDLSDLRFSGALQLRDSHFNPDVELGGAYFEQVLNLDGSSFAGDVGAYRLRVNGGVSIVRATVDGNFEADEFRAGGTANFFGTKIMGSIHLRGANIGNDLDFGGIVANGPFSDNVPEENPRSSVSKPRSAVDISNANIAGQLFMTGSKVPDGNVDLSGIFVGGSVWMEADTKLQCGLTLERGHIGNSVMLGSGRFYQIDLTAVRIDRELRLESNTEPTKWDDFEDSHYHDCRRDPLPRQKLSNPAASSSWLVMRDAQIQAIRDTPAAWPKCITLGGLIYGRPPQNLSGKPEYLVSPLHCGPPWETPNDSLAAEAMSEPRDVTWWLNWLGRDPDVTVQAYAQLATSLDAAGNREQADSIRYYERQFERDRNHGFFKKYFIDYPAQGLVGFGIGSYALLALLWAGILLAISTVCLRVRLHDLNTSLTPDKSKPPTPDKSKSLTTDESKSPTSDESKSLTPDECKVVAAKFEGKGWFWCFLASLQNILPLITFSRGMDEFLHNPVVPEKPDSRPLIGRFELSFALLAFVGVLLSGFLLQGLRNYSGL